VSIPRPALACRRAYHATNRILLRRASFSSREPSALSPGNIRNLQGYSVSRDARKNADLVTNLGNFNFLKRGAQKAQRRDLAAHECFDLAGPPGLEPATSGVTGRGSNSLVRRW